MDNEFAQNNSQIGTIGYKLHCSDMPHTDYGIISEIMNPNICTINDTNVASEKDVELNEIINKLDLNKKCNNQVMYNGTTGQKINTDIFVSPAYFQRIKK